MGLVVQVLVSHQTNTHVGASCAYPSMNYFYVRPFCACRWFIYCTHLLQSTFSFPKILSTTQQLFCHHHSHPLDISYSTATSYSKSQHQNYPYITHINFHIN
ncbi:hypothetical protein V8G54_027143 [Vigna mungo]|uniref:Uncharacterized protein n=1 Tax=Vigna mungo TaxID=3915 RepID=A0AAQ3RMS7_VIGMU